MRRAILIPTVMKVVSNILLIMFQIFNNLFVDSDDDNSNHKKSNGGGNMFKQWNM
jgi:hypothetical protein